MAVLHRLPVYSSGNISVFTSQLRSLIFSTQKDSADYFLIDRSRIARYENEEEAAPPLGYLTSLAKLVVESLTDASKEELFLLSEINNAKDDCYGILPFVNWEKMCVYADDYLEKQYERSLYKQLQKKWPKGNKKKWINHLCKRLDPQSYHELVGVDEDLAHLIELLTSSKPPWVINLVGLGGIGKTSLAHSIATKVIQEQLFDDLAWISARQESYDPQSYLAITQAVYNVEDVFNLLLEQLVPGIYRNLAVFDQKSFNLLQIRLKDIPHIVIIDNVDLLADLDTLVPRLQSLSNPTKFLLTSRKNIDDELSVQNYGVEELTVSNALALMRSEAEIRRISRVQKADTNLLIKMYEAVGGNPLALRLMVGQAKSRPIDAILTSLREGAHKENDGLLTFIFKDIWQNLTLSDQNTLASMFLSTARGVTLEHLTVLTDLSKVNLYTSLEQLIMFNLINVNDAVEESDLRYTIHALTRTYLEHDDRLSKKTSHELIIRSTQYLGQRLRQDNNLLSNEEEEQALHTLRCGLLDAALWETTRGLLMDLSPKLEQAGHRATWIPYLVQGIDISVPRQDYEAEGKLRFQLGMILQLKGDYSLAEVEFGRSAEIFSQLELPSELAKSLNRQAYVARRQRNYQHAFELVQNAMALLEPDEIELAYSKLVLGSVALDKHDFIEAEELFQESLNISIKKDDLRMMAWCWTNLGAALRPLKRYDEAIEMYKKAIVQFEDIYDPVHQAVARMNLGNVYLVQGNAQEALNLYVPVKELFEEIQEQPRLAKIHLNIGMAHSQLSQWHNAESNLLKAIELYRLVNNMIQVVNALTELGLNYMEQHKFDAAITTFQKALEELNSLQHEASYEESHRKLDEHMSIALSRKF